MENFRKAEPRQRWRLPRLALTFSLRTMFGLTAIAAVVLYFIPITNHVTGDFYASSYYSKKSGGVQWVDIEGRNKTTKFETVLSRVELIDTESSSDLRKGRWKVKFRSSLKDCLKLRAYEILRFRLLSD